MPDVQLVVTVDDEHIDRLLEVVERLKAAGMNVESLMDRLGVVAGSCDSAKVRSLSRIEGVSHVEPEREFQILELDVQ